MTEAYSRGLKKCLIPLTTQPPKTCPTSRLISTVIIILFMIFIFLVCACYLHVKDTDGRLDNPSVVSELALYLDVNNTLTSEGKFCFTGGDVTISYGKIVIADGSLKNYSDFPISLHARERMTFTIDAEENKLFKSGRCTYSIFLKETSNDMASLDTSLDIDIVAKTTESFIKPALDFLRGGDSILKKFSGSSELVARKEESCKLYGFLQTNELTASVLLCFLDYSDTLINVRNSKSYQLRTNLEREF